MQKTITYKVDEELLYYQIDGDFFAGPEYVMLDKDDNLIEHTYWAKDGYTTLTLLNKDVFEELRHKILTLLISIVQEIIGTTLEEARRYHEVVNEEQHQQVWKQSYRHFTFSGIGFDKELIENAVSRAIGVKVSTANPHQARNEDVFHLRIVRPNSVDNNPFHRDVWLDRLRHGVNLYLPLVGSNALSALPLVPGSHLWKESEIERTAAGALVNDKMFTVPAVTGGKYPLEAIRPNPKEGEAMLFSPYLIHGGGSNLNDDVTRISLEMRFWRK